jgi:GH25 family lysozyme M1 (1,4-beta-N-acetylmuramidase)
MTSQEKIAVIEAQDRGRKVQFRVRTGGHNATFNASYYGYGWHNPEDSLINRGQRHEFQFGSYDYRIAPKNTVRLNAEYVAEVGPEYTTVGCQKIPNSKIKEVAALIP